MSDRKNIYFASDFHLGSPDYQLSRQRENQIVAWLDQIEGNASEIYLMGDLFDFWFEYKTVVPKGYIRLLGKLARLSDAGIRLTIFKGNHDLWMKDYFVRELNAEVVSQPIVKTFENKTFYLAHGDGLGPGDYGYKFINRIFKAKVNQFLFSWLHPDMGSKIARYFSDSSRIYQQKTPLIFNGDKERLVIHARNILKERHIDYFIFGHRHIPVDYLLNDHSRLINLGDMFNHFSYAFFDGDDVKLLNIS